MSFNFRIFAFCILVAIGFALTPIPLVAQRPNIVLMMADDLGYSDLGCYGGEIETPNLDSLATKGLRFTNFYNTGRCWPTRASLLTGYYPHQVRRDKLPGVKPSGGGGKRPDWAPLLPKLLKPNGYRSYHIGKWHIDSMPVKEGFDRSYYLGDQARFFSPKSIFVDDKRRPAIERGTDYYATIDLADQAVAQLKEHAVNHTDDPFFQYIAWTAPHFPLHALPEDIAKYEEMYLKGWDHFREQRWQAVQQKGLADDQLSDVEPETGAPYERPDDIKAYGPGEVAFPAPWDSLTDEQRRFQATKMAIHAAMIDRIDVEIGKIITQLKEMGAYENTVIMFLSDNGASAELMIRDDGHDPNAAPGSADTHLCLGPGWSTVSNTPFRKHKTWVHEGGIATPFIVHWPKAKLDQGQLRHNPGHVIDIVPTIMDLAGDTHVAIEGAPKPPGKSLVKALATDNSVEHDYLWWSHENHNAIRVGDWKAVKTSKSDWELFNLEADRAETNDLSGSNSDKRDELIELWKAKQLEFIESAKQGLPEPKANQEKKEQPEATSLLGKPLFRVKASGQRLENLVSNLKQARNELRANPNDPNGLIWLGRRQGYLWRYNDAINTFTQGIDKHPEVPHLYRHRGHRYITVRNFDAAVSDFNRAVELIEGTADEVEPDGAPNEKGIPLTTLHSNVWYHLGLAHYLRAEYELALNAFSKCNDCVDNDDNRVSTADWMYMILRRMGNDDEAARLLEQISPDMEIIENHAYHRRLLMYKGELSPDDLVPDEGSESYDLDMATYGYGIGNWYLVNGDTAKAKETFEKVIEGKYWAAFGYIAAESDLARMREASK